MRRYVVSYSSPVSSAVNTPTQAIGLVTGAGRMCAVYEVVLGQSGVANDAQVRCDLYGVSALTPGSSLNPVPVDSGAPAPVTAMSSAPTGVTNSGLSLLALVYNGRATVRWAAVDPDSRISVPAGGGAAGSLVLQNQQPGTVVGLSVLSNLFFVE